MSQIPIERLTLPNGLRMVHSYDPSTAMVAVDVLYDVGSRDERRELTGMAHLFEHLMFGGSANIPDYDAVVERAGGSNNAWTSPDFTNFYITVPAQNAETAFYLESDRMLALSFADKALEVQRGVVTEEFKQQCIDAPYGMMMHHLRRLSYAPEHPYSWPTIGLTPEHIAKVTPLDVKQWFYSHYAPNNAVISVTGNITFARAAELTRKWFGDIETRPVAVRRMPDPGFPAADISETVEGKAPSPVLCLTFPMAAYGCEGYAAADAVTDLLSLGRASRLSRRLVYGRGQGLFAASDASIIGSEGPGLMMLISVLTDSEPAAVARAKEMLFEELDELRTPANFAGREFGRMLNSYESEFRFSNMGYLALAQALAQAEMHGRDINATVDERRRLSPEAVAAEAERMMNNPHVELVYKS